MRERREKSERVESSKREERREEKREHHKDHHNQDPPLCFHSSHAIEPSVLKLFLPLDRGKRLETVSGIIATFVELFTQLTKTTTRQKPKL